MYPFLWSMVAIDGLICNLVVGMGLGYGNRNDNPSGIRPQSSSASWLLGCHLL